jgi:hypothetical protein
MPEARRALALRTGNLRCRPELESRMLLSIEDKERSNIYYRRYKLASLRAAHFLLAVLPRQAGYVG